MCLNVTLFENGFTKNLNLGHVGHICSEDVTKISDSQMLKDNGAILGLK